MPLMQSRVALVAIVGSIWTVSVADSWPPPPRFWPSKDGNFRVSVSDPSKNGLKITMERRQSKGWEMLWSTRSPQSAPPYRVHFSKKGDYVVLQDQWANVGKGKVICLLGSRGQALRSFSLDDLIPKEEQQLYSSSVSSLMWTNNLSIGMLNDGKSFAFVTKFGTAKQIDLPTGRLIHLSLKMKRDLISELKGKT